MHQFSKNSLTINVDYVLWYFSSFSNQSLVQFGLRLLNTKYEKCLIWVYFFVLGLVAHWPKKTHFCSKTAFLHVELATRAKNVAAN